MDNILPHNNPYLIGHEEAERIFLNAWNNGTLHNSWLINGAPGIGKATFAYKAARFLLAADAANKENYNSLDIDQNSQAFRLVATNAHPDLKIIERDFIETDKKKIIKAIKDGEALSDNQLQDLKRSSVIKIDEVREINEFFSKKSLNDNWRIVIVDSADDLNVAGANAILKVLEEPPAKSILFLISHNPDCLLPTIKSRCAKFNLQPLADSQICSLLRRYRPELSEAEVKGIASVCGGSIGKALNYADYQGLEIYHQLEKILYARMSFDLSEALELCENAAKDENMWKIVTDLILRFLTDNMKSGENVKALGEAWDKTTRLLAEVISLNMDKKQVLLNIIYSICKAL